MTTGDRRPANTPPSTPPNAPGPPQGPGQPASGPDPHGRSQGRDEAAHAWAVANRWMRRSDAEEAFRAGWDAAALDTALGLLTRVKAVVEPDGSWPGGDVVDVLTSWFTERGLNIDMAPRRDVTLAPPGVTSRFYTVDEENPDAPRLVIEYQGPHHGRVRPGDRVVYENPAWRRSDGSYFTCGLDGPLTVTEIIDLGGGHPPQAILQDGDLEVSADNLRALPEEASDDA